MGNDFEKFSLKELFTNVGAFLGFSIAILAGLVALLLLTLFG
jgi:hypothetical protein